MLLARCLPGESPLTVPHGPRGPTVKSEPTPESPPPALGLLPITLACFNPPTHTHPACSHLHPLPLWCPPSSPPPLASPYSPLGVSLPPKTLTSKTHVGGLTSVSPAPCVCPSSTPYHTGSLIWSGTVSCSLHPAQHWACGL